MQSFASELEQQPDALRALIAAYSRKPGPLGKLARMGRAGVEEVLFLGMGSSLFAAHPAVCALARDGIRAAAFDAGEYLHYLWRTPGPRALPVLISQSGKSGEIVKLAERLRGCRFVAVTNAPDSPLARAAEHVLPLMAGEETATTSKTYTNSLAACRMLAACLAGKEAENLTEELAQVADRMAEGIREWRAAVGAAADFLGDPVHLDLVGRGPSLATAGQGALILRELAHLKCAAVSAGQFRHGMIPSMRKGSGLIAFAPPTAAGRLTSGLAADVGRAGGRALVVSADKLDGSVGLRAFPIPETAEDLAPLLEIIPVELLGLEIAKRRGIEPGEGLVKVTTAE